MKANVKGLSHVKGIGTLKLKAYLGVGPCIRVEYIWLRSNEVTFDNGKCMVF